MGEKRYRISFEIDEESLRVILNLNPPGAIENMVNNPQHFPATIVNAWDFYDIRPVKRRYCEKVEIVQDEAPKQSEGAGHSCGQTDDGQVLNQLGDAYIPKPIHCLHCGHDRVVVTANYGGRWSATRAECERCGSPFSYDTRTLPKPCPICNKCNVDTPELHAKHASQADEKEHPEDFCMFCGGELAHCDNSLWDGVWVHSVCIPY